jgi:molybdenum cofactor biosynthesis enzyme MoaA
MVLSQIPVALVKRCRHHHQLKRTQAFAFSTLPKLETDDDDDDVHGQVHVHHHAQTHHGNGDGNRYESLQKLQRIKNNQNNNQKTNNKTKAISNMPRLEELRERLAKNDDTNAPLLKAITTSLASSSSSENANTDVEVKDDKNHITWREVLETAKQHFLSHREHTQADVLTDAYSRKHSYLRISLGERCNLRCLYCMPPEGVPLQSNEKILNSDEISRLVQLFSSRGVDKVRLTGGEPLLRKDLPQIISSIADEPTINSIGITTNGITLSRKLPSLVENGLTHANISLDTLQEHKFEEITRRKGLTQVLKAIKDASKILPKGNVKVNCVVMKGFNDNELRDFIHLTKDLAVDIRFIEWMPFNDNGWNKDRFLSYDDMMKQITSDEFNQKENGGTAATTTASMQGLPAFNLERLEDGPNDTTKWWQVPGHIGRVGFITSMTQHFCGSCNRLRVTADGQLKVCLFGSAEISLRDAMREGASDEDLGMIIWAALQNKHFALGGHGNAEGIKKANDNRPMTLIGG